MARVGLMSSFLLMSSFPMSCFGIIVLDFIEWIIVDVPNSPVRRGRRGCLMPIFSDANPKNPARMKIKMAFVFDSFSL